MICYVSTFCNNMPGFESNPNNLFRFLHAQLTPEILDSIANADRGFDYDDHLIQLKEIQNSSLLPIPIDPYLGEVLSLCRWSAGKKVNHLRRAFACPAPV